MKEAKILVILNSLWNLVNFRKNLIKSLIKNNYKVIVVAPFDENYDEVLKIGCKIIGHDFNKRKTNIIKELFSLIKLSVIIFKENPNICLSFTIKPNIYASLVCNILKIPIINNITGMGLFLEKGKLLRSSIMLLYKFMFGSYNFVFFQNKEDLSFFKKKFLKNKVPFDLLPGSGIDLKKFNTNQVFIKKKDELVFILVSRMLWSKGIYEFYKAAKNIKKKYSNIKFNILGPFQGSGDEAIDYEIIKNWEKEKVIKYLGYSQNVKKYLLLSDCLILPTFYNEGTPKIILEASALKIPVITTNIKGCNIAVDDNVTGFLCKPKCISDLSLKIEKFINLTHHEKIKMGKNGRLKMEKYYDEKFVVKKYHEKINEIIHK